MKDEITETVTTNVKPSYAETIAKNSTNFLQQQKYIQVSEGVFSSVWPVTNS